MSINGGFNAEKDGSKPLSEMQSINENLECLVTENVTSKFRAFRNVFIICFTYFLFFTGFWSLTNLQSTMNADQGMGVDSLAVIYFCATLSCLFPELLIEKFGAKTTYALSLLLSTPYIAANFSLRWDTMMMSSVLFGLIYGPLNTSLTVYIDEMAIRFNAGDVKNQENVSTFFFGLCMFFSKLTQVVGNAITYLILMKGHAPAPSNFSVEAECGINFQPGSLNNTNLNPPLPHQKDLVIGIFVSLSLMAIVLAFVVDPLKNDLKEVKGCQTISRKVTNAVKQMKKPHQLLLLPLSVYCGVQGSFYSADFTEAFIACSWGVYHVGFVTICFGVCGAVISMLFGPIVKYVSLMPVLLFGSIGVIVTCALLFVWRPSPDVPIAYFLFSGSWGVTDSIFWGLLTAVHGLMFPDDREAAFSVFFFWAFLGHFLCYMYASYFSVVVKMYILLTCLILGTVLYVIGQVQIKCFSNKSDYTAIRGSDLKLGHDVHKRI